MKRRTKILLLLLLALILGVILLLPHGGYRREVEAYKKQLLAQGEKLTVAELAPPPPTNASDAVKAFMEALKNSKFSVLNQPGMMKIISPGVAMPGHTNAGREMTANYEQNIAKMAELRPILGRPDLHFQPDYSNGISMLLPHLAYLRDSERLASTAATQALHAGNFAEAWSDMMAAVDLLRPLNDEPVMMSGLVRITMVQLAMSATWMFLNCGHEWSDAQLAELQAKWQGMDFFALAESLMAMERVSAIEMFAEARVSYGADLIPATLNPTGGLPTSGSSWLGGLSRKAAALYYRYPGFWLWKSSWSYDEELYSLEVTTKAKAAAHRMLTTGEFVSAYHELLREETNRFKSHPQAARHFWLTGRDDIFSSYLVRFADAETIRRLTVTAISLKRYQLQHNASPASLSELVPVLLPEVPADLMDGKPLRYRPKSDGTFLLYSVGTDGKDDGGDPTSVALSKYWIDARDIVWPRAATPQEVGDYLKRHPAETNLPAR